MVPKDIYVLILEPVNVTLHCRRDFADVIKDTENREIVLVYPNGLYIQSQMSF